MQERREKPLPDDAIIAVTQGVQGACEQLGLDYATLDSIPDRIGLKANEDPFYVRRAPSYPYSDYGW